MDTKKLRQKILDLAIRGKLVPQDPNDEPASVLLERIRAEKELLIKEGKIKRSKKSASADKSHYENPPFEIPDSWEWVVGGEVFLPMISCKPQGDEFKYIDIDSVDNRRNKITSSKVLMVKKAPSRASRYTKKGDVLFSMVRPYLKNIALVEEESCIASTGFFVCSPTQLLTSEYCYYMMLSDYVVSGLNQYMKGDNSPSINNSHITTWLYPIPPVSEQRRIVAEIQKWFKYISTLDGEKIELEASVNLVKSKILDLAISGKLVPQDPNDEPAIELLRRINPAFQPCDNSHYENLPFEIPDSWELCKFGDFLDVRDGTHNSPRYLEKGYPLVTSKNLKNGDIDFDTAKFISTEDYINFSQRSFVEDGDILFAMIGSIGNPVLVKKCREFSIKNVALFKPYDKIHTNMKYVFYYLLYVEEKLKYEAKGGMQPFIPLNYFRKELYIPIPPYNEQERIVEKVSKIFEKIDSITAEL